MGMISGAGAAWQLELETMEERCGYLLTSGIWTDCTFMVGRSPYQEAFPAHKLILAMVSPVFEAMLYGGFDNEPIISIPDLHPDDFRALLPYIYTGDVNITSLEIALGLWYSAKKYLLPHLVTKCTSYLMSAVSTKNACKIYENSCLLDEQTLKDKCFQIITSETKEVLKDGGFEHVEPQTLFTVFSSDHLNVDSELDLFYALERYANQERPQHCPEDGRQQDSVTTEEKVVDKKPATDNENLEDESPSLKALKMIRFLSLTPQQFAEGPAHSDLLTKDESFALLMNIASADSPVPMPHGFSQCREQRHPRLYLHNE